MDNNTLKKEEILSNNETIISSDNETINPSDNEIIDPSDNNLKDDFYKQKWTMLRIVGGSNVIPYTLKIS